VAGRAAGLDVVISLIRNGISFWVCASSRFPEESAGASVASLVGRLEGGQTESALIFGLGNRRSRRQARALEAIDIRGAGKRILLSPPADGQVMPKRNLQRPSGI